MHLDLLLRQGKREKGKGKREEGRVLGFVS
jgi:hypothetical protein